MSVKDIFNNIYNDINMGKLMHSQKKVFQYHLIQQKFSKEWPGSEPGPPWWEACNWPLVTCVCVCVRARVYMFNICYLLNVSCEILYKYSESTLQRAHSTLTSISYFLGLCDATISNLKCNSRLCIIFCPWGLY